MSVAATRSSGAAAGIRRQARPEHGKRTPKVANCTGRCRQLTPVPRLCGQGSTLVTGTLLAEPFRAEVFCRAQEEGGAMVAWDNVTRDDVMRATYDRLGQEQFFAQHGLGPRRGNSSDDPVTTDPTFTLLFTAT